MVHKRPWVTGVALVVAVLVSGCASDEKKAEVLQCPQVAVVKELATYMDFGRTEEPTNDDLVGQAMMVKQSDECDDNDDRLVSEITLRIFAKKGPRLGEGGLTAPYFLAVLDAADNIVSKETMSASFAFGKNGLAEFNDIVRITLPKTAAMDPSQYRIWIGFQLGKEQLETLRRQRDQQAMQSVGQ